MVTQLVHVGVVLGHDRDGVALLANDEASLLLGGVPQVNAIILRERNDRMGAIIYSDGLTFTFIYIALCYTLVLEYVQSV